jgi:outer membrane protein insertion porin family
LDAYNTSQDYTDFKERKLGFGVNTSYPLKYFRIPFFGESKQVTTKGSDYLESDPPPTMWDYMRGGVAYELYRQKISGVSSNAPISIADEEGSSVTSAMTPNISYDSRDHFFNPTEGSKWLFSTKFAGLGGDNAFIRNDISAKWYYPLLKDPRWGGAYVLSLGGILGYGIGLKQQNGNNDLPLSDRYFIGGINTVRGFADRSIAPRECDSDGKNCDIVGGDKAVVFNADLMFPVMEQYGLRGDVFFDMGSSFSGSDGFNFNDYRTSVGVGARWMSPFGPLRVELGFPLTKKSYDDTSVLGFSFGNQP